MKKNEFELAIKKELESEAEKLKLANETKKELAEKNLLHFCWLIRDAFGLSNNTRESTSTTINEIKQHILYLFKNKTRPPFSKEFEKIEEVVCERFDEMVEDYEKWLIQIGKELWDTEKLSKSELERITRQIYKFKIKYKISNQSLTKVIEEYLKYENK